jgi:uncharacterized protein (DUF1501 family)
MRTTRREFLRAGALGALGLGVVGQLDAVFGAAAPRTAGGDPVVVAVNLFGGNDGLNTIVPLAQYDRYHELRGLIGWQREQLIELPGHSDDFGLNPGMLALASMFAQGRVAIVNGVGSPPDAQGLFDHEASQKNLQTGDTYGAAPPSAPTGWLGRFLDGLDAAELPGGIDFSTSPLLLTGRASQPLALQALSGFGVYPSADAEARTAAYRRLQNVSGQGAVQQYNSRLRLQVQALSGKLQAISDSYEVADGVTYPFTSLAAGLRDCAALIAADRGVRALAVGLAGFDTHSGQNLVQYDGPPFHQYLWTTVSDAVDAFHADLRGHGLGDRVVTLIFSEFGRRAHDNNDAGTDHGYSSSLFVIGDRVKGGVYGAYPDLREDRLVLEGNLDVHVDFRSVYATILARHLDADPERILAGSFAQLGFL